MVILKMEENAAGGAPAAVVTTLDAQLPRVEITPLADLAGSRPEIALGPAEPAA